MDRSGTRIRFFIDVRPAVLFLAACLMIFGCAGPAAQQNAGAGVSPSAQGPKTLRIAQVVAEEPHEGLTEFGRRQSAGDSEYTYIFHDGFTVYDAQGNLIPRMAQKVPSLSDGDWKVLPDGRMEVTWKLRPDIKWHDGTAATADDFAFGLEVLQDPALPFVRSSAANLVTEVEVSDPTTLVVRWKQTSIDGNVSGPTDIPALPRHLMSDLYRKGDKEAFTNSPFWSAEFVGLGPYRLGEWANGSRLEGLAFDGYYLGRPNIDRVIFQFYGDSNVTLANLLAGAADMSSFGAFGLAHLAQIKNVWDPAGTGTTFSLPSGTRNYRYQFRDSDAPWAKDVRVRRALVHMLDRQAIADTMMGGLVGPADTVVAPNDPIYRLVEQRGLARYPFDTAQADRLMSEAGWPRATTGGFRSPSGEPFTIDISMSGEPENIREAEAVAGQWKAAGVEVTLSPIPDAATNKDELRHAWKGAHATNLRDRLDAMLPAFVTDEIGTPANRWRGANRGGYSNPEYDALYARVFSTLDTGPRQALVADMLKLLDDNVIAFHLFYDPGQATSAVRNGIRGPAPGSSITLSEAWNIRDWDMD